jgi:hypothetical protein
VIENPTDFVWELSGHRAETASGQKGLLMEHVSMAKRSALAGVEGRLGAVLALPVGWRLLAFLALLAILFVMVLR